MQLRVFITLSMFVLGLVANGQDLNFETTAPLWPPTATSNNYSLIGSPATNVSIALSGNLQFQTGQPTVKSYGLYLAMNWTTNTNSLTMTINFSPGVSNPSFTLRDVDRSSSLVGELYNYVDLVTVFGFDGPTPVTPSIDAQADNVVSGNSLLGTGSGTPMNKVTFSGFVSKIIIVYANNVAQTVPNPGTQAITVGDLSWDGPLPVVLKSFSGQQTQSGVQLNWSTASERLSERFEVERSSDAISFETIGSVGAAGSAEEGRTYSFWDERPLVGLNYYRLRQVDLNGVSDNSRIIKVAFAPDGFIWQVNANGGNIIVHTTQPEPIFRLFLSDGRLIPVSVESVSENKYRLRLQTPIQRALYLLQMQVGSIRYTKKIVVLP